jgi:hypothetical protein
MVILIQNKIIITLIALIQLSACSLFRPGRPSSEELVNQSFSEEQRKEVSESMNSWIETDLHYNLGSTRHISNANWILLDPIFIRSDFNRAVGLIPNWHIKKDKIYNSLIWVCGFREKGEWYFFRPSETQYIQFKEGADPDFSPLTWKGTRNTIDRYTQGYLKYDKSQRAWVINDLWFRGFMDNAARLDKSEKGLSDNEILALPDAYWVDKYMDFQRMSKRYLDLIKDKRREQDYKKEHGLYTDYEWAEIVRLRNPQTSQDKKDLRESRKEMFQDSIMMALEDKIMKRIGQGKYFGK